MNIPSGNINGTGQNTIMSTRQPSDTSFDLDVKAATGEVHCDIGNGTEWLTTTAKSTGVKVELGLPYQIVVVATEAGWKIYVNGNNKELKVEGGYEKAGIPLIWDATHTLQLGRLQASGFHFGGVLDEVSFYSTALSEARVKVHYLAGISTVTVTNPGRVGTPVGTETGLAIKAVGATSYAATPLPTGLTINSSTGIIEGKPTTEGTTAVKVTVKGAAEASAQTEFNWVVEESMVWPPVAKISTLETPETELSEGGKWLVNEGPEGIEGPGRVFSDGWSPPDNKGGNLVPPHSYGAYYKVKQFNEGAAAWTIVKPWIEAPSAEIPGGLDSCGLFVSYKPGEGGYSVNYGKASAEGTTRMQIVYQNFEGTRLAADTHIAGTETVEAYGNQLRNNKIRAWIKTSGFWRCTLVVTRAEMEALPAGYWRPEGFISIEALGKEGRGAKLYGWAKSEEAKEPVVAATGATPRAGHKHPAIRSGALA